MRINSRILIVPALVTALVGCKSSERDGWLDDAFTFAPTGPRYDLTSRPGDVPTLGDELHDPSFADDGRFVHDTSAGGSDRSSAVVLDAGGRILVAGQSEGLAVWRLLPSGALDPDFGVGGVFRSSDWGASSFATARDLALDSAGRIIVVGSTPVSASEQDVTVWRLTPGGSPDNTWAGIGRVTLDLSSGGADDSAWGVAIDDQDRVAVAGESRVDEDGTLDSRMFVARFDVDGGIDGTFGSSGIVVETTMDGSTRARDIAVDDQGRLVVVGSRGWFDTDALAADLAVWRFLDDGSPDSSFGGVGVVTDSDPVAGRSELARAVALDAVGRIVVVGSITDSDAVPSSSTIGDATSDLLVLRFDDGGALDPWFGAGGRVVRNLTSIDVSDHLGEHHVDAVSVVIDEEQRICVAGSSHAQVQWSDWTPSASYYPPGLVVWRLTSAGALDSAFNGTGIAYLAPYPLEGSSYRPARGFQGRAITIDLAGRLVIAGEDVASSGSDADLAVWRLIP